MRDLNRGSEWDFGSEKDIILISFFKMTTNEINTKSGREARDGWEMSATASFYEI